MKAPTADYSPLSQALSAKNSAIQSGYAAKDAQNWKSRYEIQQQSLDLQQEAINDSQWQNVINLGLNLANTYFDYKAKSDALKVENENLELSEKSRLYGQGLDTITAKYGENATYEVMTEEEGRDGRYMKASTVQNPEMQAEIKDLQTKIFGSEGDWSEKSWKRIQNMISLSDGALQESMWQSYNNSISQENAKLFSTQYSGLMTEASQMDAQMVDVSYDDGNGGKVTKSIPASVDNLIGGLTTATDAEKQNLRISAAKEYEQLRFDYLSGSVADAITSGASEEDIVGARDKALSYIDSITDEKRRQELKESFKTSYSKAVSDRITETASQIADSRSGTEYEDALQLYYSLMPDDGKPYKDANGKEYSKGGLMYLFRDSKGKPLEYCAPGTASSARNSLDETLTGWRTSYGATKTQEVKTGIDTAIAAYNVDHDSENLVKAIRSVVTDAYGDGSEGYSWTEDPVAYGAVKAALDGILPNDWMKNGKVEAAFRFYLTDVLNVKDAGTTSDMIAKLSAEQKKEFTDMQEQFVERLVDEIIRDPSVYLDPEKTTAAVNQLMLAYGQDFHELYGRYNKFGKSDVGKDENAHEVSAKELYKVYSPTGDGAYNILSGMPDISKPGEYMVSGNRLKYSAGIGEGLKKDANVIYSFLSKANGMNISDDFMVRYDVSNEGVEVDLAFPIRGKDGNNTLEYVYYNLNTNEWEYSSPGMDDTLAGLAGDADPVAFNNVVEFMNENKDDEGNIDPVALVGFASDKEEFELVTEYLTEQALEGKMSELDAEEFDFTGRNADAEFERFREMIKSAGTIDNASALLAKHSAGLDSVTLTRLNQEYTQALYGAIESGEISRDSASAVEEQGLLPEHVVEAINGKMEELNVKLDSPAPAGEVVDNLPDILGEEGTNIGAIRKAHRMEVSNDLGTGTARDEQKGINSKVNDVPEVQPKAEQGVEPEGSVLPDDIQSAYDSIQSTADSKAAQTMLAIDDIEKLESMWKDLTGSGVWAYDAYREELRKIYEWKKDQLGR